MNKLAKITLNVIIGYVLVHGVLGGNNLRSAEGKLSKVDISLDQMKQYANCLNLKYASVDQWNAFFENQAFEDMNFLGRGHFGQVREPQVNHTKLESDKLVIKKIEVEKNKSQEAINEFYYWQLIQSKKTDESSGFYQSLNFPIYYGCAYNEGQSGQKDVYYIKMEKINNNFQKDNTSSPVNSFSGLTRIQKLRTYLSLFNAIRQMHSEDIVHLDIKPDNFMTRESFMVMEPKYPRIVLVDMGLAQPAGKLYKTGNLRFMHPTAFNRADEFPMIKAFDVYSAILSVLIIEGYQLYDHNTDYYFEHSQYLKQRISIAEHFKNLQNSINKDFNLTLQKNLFSDVKAEHIEECFDLNCLLSFGINDDINEIPTIDQFYNQLEKIISYTMNRQEKIQSNQLVFKMQFERSINFFDQAQRFNFCQRNSVRDISIINGYKSDFDLDRVPLQGYAGSTLFESSNIQKFNNIKPYFNRKLNSIYFVQKMQNRQGNKIVEVETCFVGKIESYYRLKYYEHSFDFEFNFSQANRQQQDKLQSADLFLKRQDRLMQYKELFVTLKTLHKSQIVHLHISPQNIVLDEKKQLRLLDYGLQNLSEPIDTVDENFSHPRMFQDAMAYTFYDIYSLTLTIFYIESLQFANPLTNNFRFFPENIKFKDYFTNGQSFMKKVDDIYTNIVNMFKGVVEFPGINQSNCMQHCFTKNQTDYGRVLCNLILNIRMDEQNIPSVYTILEYMPKKAVGYI